MDKCPKCKKNSLKKSIAYPTMIVCQNKECLWYLKDDINKLAKEYNLDDDGFEFQRTVFKDYYKEIKEKNKVKIPSSIIQASLFVIDFLKKENCNFIVIIDDDKKFSNIKKVMNKHRFKKHITFIKYKDFFNINIEEENYLFINLNNRKEKYNKIKKIIPSLAKLYEVW